MRAPTARPNRIIIANGIVGMMSSEDGGATWQRMKMPGEANYPDAVVIHPDRPDLLFMSAGVGWLAPTYVAGEILPAGAIPARSRSSTICGTRVLQIRDAA